jgi:hypothetical protein
MSVMDLYSLFLKNQGRIIHKWKHYFPIYERHFSRFRGTSCIMYEIGVGSGGSLQMWKEYLGPHAKIIGIDINASCKAFEEDQIHVRIGSQDDTAFLQSVLNEFGYPDIVLDDGSHIMQHVNTTFDFLYPKISRTGVYMIEDLHTAYFDAYGGGIGNKGSFIEKAKGIVDYINGDYWGNPQNPYNQNTMSISFYDSVVVLERGFYSGAKTAFAIGKNG